MNQNNLKSLLKDFDSQEVENFVAYCEKLDTEKKKDGNAWVVKNLWFKRVPDEKLARLFKTVSGEGLVFDGIDITLQSTGVSYNYKAFKNKMLIAYPESMVDVSLVYEGDDYEFSKKDGKVFYNHKIADPFKRNESDIIGGYCVIRNNRGEFFTSLNLDEIQKHRMVAKTDYIWKKWFVEMCMKTIIKKACGLHFRDVFKGIETSDNENYNVENPLDLKLEHKQEIDEIDSLDKLREYYLSRKGRGKDFDKYVFKRKKELQEIIDKEKAAAPKEEKPAEEKQPEEKPPEENKKTPAPKKPKTCPHCAVPDGAIHDKECPNFKK